MRNRGGVLALLLTALMAAGTLAGLAAARKRLTVEKDNRRVEIAVEWSEVSNLAQISGHPLADLLLRFKAQGVTALVIQEDTLVSLEQTGAVRPISVVLTPERSTTLVLVDSAETLQRIQTALRVRGLRTLRPTPPTAEHPASPLGETRFVVLPNGANVSTRSLEIETLARTAAPAETALLNYTSLRTLGLGLPPDAVAAAQAAQMHIAGRIANFAGVRPANAEATLRSLAQQGTSLVIFSGDEVLGYRGIETEVASLLRDPAQPAPTVSVLRDAPTAEPMPPAAPTGLLYGAMEFGKQKGDEKLSAALHGDYVRVHAIPAAELATLEESEIVDRFVKAARERNIRFCYVRLLTFAGDDPIGRNVDFLKRIADGMARGSEATGGDLKFGAARRYAELGVSWPLFSLVALGVAAGVVWMLRTLCPLPEPTQRLLLVALSVACVGAAVGLGETGRKLVALLAGIVFPATACLRTVSLRPTTDVSAPQNACGAHAVRLLLVASGITAIGIVYVIGLLATRPFLLHANQFLGIKAQHAVPLLLVAYAALVGGGRLPGEKWASYRRRASAAWRAALREPARFGPLLLGLVGLAALYLIVARTGNDAGVGVSGVELKARAVLDRFLPARPRTKEFLLGHPAFVLGCAWWLRGRRRLALPFLVVGSIGQASLLNTFCHIHTPLVISLWRDGIGLALGALIGLTLFFGLERLLPPPEAFGDSPQRQRDG